jgi:ATP/maltotriose-dependent transcriptional regulator MalT/DNA-binding SARP family transcriptional activator
MSEMRRVAPHKYTEYYGILRNTTERQKTLNDLHPHRKVRSPALPAAYLHREGLVHHMNTLISGSGVGVENEVRSLPYKLVLLHAPAGYGKTTLLVDFAQQASLPCCWYFLDQTDTDCITFIAVLLMSLRQCFPDFGRTLDPLLARPSSTQANHPTSVSYVKMVVDTLVNAMETEIPAPFAILLCNYQEINECEEINALIGYLIQKLPSQCVLVIESRIIPTLDFVHLLAGQMISSIGIDHLRFTLQQIHELARIQEVEPFSDAEAQQVVFAFDGWITGILLCTRLSSLHQSPQNLTTPLCSLALDRQERQERQERQASSYYLFSYVVNEVFKYHQAQAAYTFLKEACVLQEMSAPLCADLLGISLAQASSHLQYLEQQNLFVTHSATLPDLVYTCTPALRNLFCEQMRYEASERFFALHRRASELLSTSQNYPQAIYHALEANINEIAVSQIIESDEHMMNQGHAMILARWIDTFSPSTTKCYPQLLLIRVHIYLRQGDYTSALPLLATIDTSMQLMAQTSPLDMPNFLLLQSEIEIVRSRILFQEGEYQQSKLLCQQVLGSLPVDEVKLRAYASMRLGLCSLQLGDFTAGITQIQKALQLWGRHTIQRQTAEGHSALATAYSRVGNFTLAEHHITRALACWNHLQDVWGKIENRVTLGNIRLCQGASDEAESIFQEALTQARAHCFLRGQAYALSRMSLCYHHQEHYERALEMAEEALALAQRINDQFLVNAVLCDLAIIYLAMGDTVTPMILLSEVKTQAPSGEAIGYQSALRDLVYGTIYLYQGQYSLAWPYLSTSEATLSKVELKEEHLQSLLRLAAYHLAQDQVRDALQSIEAAATIIPLCAGYERLALRELRHLPCLHQAIKTLPEFAHIRTLLHLEIEPQIMLAHEALPLVHEKELPMQSVLPFPASEVTLRSYPLTIHALGEPIVSLHNVPVTRWRMARAMELFFYLLEFGRPMRKDSIISALWMKIDEQTTRTFYSTIYYLRQALGGESVIVAKGGTYALRLDVLYGQEVWYDVVAFEGFQVRAKQALDAGYDEEARASYQAMVDLYRGDYIQPFYSDWCSARRDELRNAYLEAHHQLALIAWRAEQFDESIVHWQRMLAFDNWLEQAHYGLMRCYAHQGKRGLVLRQYQRCKDVLKQEFDTVPGASIQKLYLRLTERP